MFKCKKCKNVASNTKEFRVITEIRNVTYIRQVKLLPQFTGYETTNDTKPIYKVVGKSEGTEIAKEESYCKKHIPKHINPKVLKERVTRKQIIATQVFDPRRVERGKNGKTRRYNKTTQ